MNGVKDMQGYRVALNLSYILPDGGNSSESCDSQDDVETGAILVIKYQLIAGSFGLEQRNSHSHSRNVWMLHDHWLCYADNHQLMTAGVL